MSDQFETALQEKMNQVKANLPAGKIKQPAKIAFLFTGQGSQYPNMTQKMYQTSSVFKQHLDDCAQRIEPYLSVKLLDLFFSPTEQVKINQTAYTQPAIFAAEYALAQLWLSLGVKPDYLMGHSVGEYVAATLAGVMSLDDALMLISLRAKLMQSLPAGGGMLAVLTNQDQVKPLLSQLQQQYPTKVLDIAAINAPNQVVLSGTSELISSFAQLAEKNGLMAQPLTVSHAFHSHLMDPILDAFKQEASKVTFHSPKIPIISNLTAKVLSPEEINAHYWCEHLRNSVQFLAGVKTLESLGTNIYLEVGAHAILSSCTMQSLSNKDTSVCMPTLHRMQDNWQSFFAAIEKLQAEKIL